MWIRWVDWMKFTISFLVLEKEKEKDRTRGLSLGSLVLSTVIGQWWFFCKYSNAVKSCKVVAPL